MANKKEDNMDGLTKIKGRELSLSDVKEVLNYTYEDFDNIETFKNLFCNTSDKKAKYNLNDRFTLPKGNFFNENEIPTTLGRYYVNRLLLEGELIKLIGYQNVVLNKDNIGGLLNKVTNLYKENKIETEVLYTFYNRLKWIGYRTARYVNASLTDEIIQPSDDVLKKKEELIEKYKDVIENNDILGYDKLKKELLDYAKEDLEKRGVADSDIYDSGARGSYGNNYMINALMRGPMQALGKEGEYHISTASLLEGIPPEEMNYYADLATIAAYSRGVSTREGGYESKKTAMAMQSTGIGPRGSDCKTKLGLVIKLDDSNLKFFYDRYIIEKDGSLVLLTRENSSKYINKTVTFRSPMFCNDSHTGCYCNKCMGELFYKLDFDKETGKADGDYTYGLGMIANRIGTTLLNQSLKKFHDMSLKIGTINISDFIEPI